MTHEPLPPNVAAGPATPGVGGMPPGGPPPSGAPFPPPPGSPSPAWGPSPIPPSWRVEPVPGTTFGLLHLAVPPVTSGLAVSSLLAGIGSVVVALVVACFGVAGMRDGWGAWAAGAFAVLSGLAGVAGIGLAVVGIRQIRSVSSPSAVRFTGRGLAIAGMACGVAGLVMTLLSFLLALLLQLT